MLLTWPGRLHAWEMVRGVTRFAMTRRWLLDQMRPESVPPQLLADRDIHGIIGYLYEPELMDAIQRSGIAAVNLTRFDDGPLFPSVLVDDAACGRMAADYYLERGFSNFAFLGNEKDNSFSQARGEGFVGRIREVRGEDFSFHWLGADKMAALKPRRGVPPEVQYAWLHELPKPIAVFTVFDLYSLNMSNACQAAGVDVPVDVAILGVHNARVTCEMAYPALSSIATPVEQVGYQAAELLDRLFHGEEVTGPPIELPPLGVVSRSSTDVVAVTDELVAEAVRYMRRHVGKGIDVADVVEALSVSRRNLERHFLKALGRTPLTELKRLRVRMAMDRLASTSETITELAYRCGYSRVDVMAKAIREETGLTPTAYRKKFNGQKG